MKTLAIIFTLAAPISLGVALVRSGEWSQAATSKSDMTFGIAIGMAAAAVCTWVAWWLT